MVALIGTEDTNFLIDETNKSWIKCEETKKRNGDIERKYSILPMELSKYIKENLNYIFVRGAAVEMPLMYVYTNGYYKLVSDNEMKAFIKQYIPYQLRKSRDINEVYLDLITEMKFVNYEDLNSNEDIINFQDGILNIRTMEFMPHSPDIYSTVQIPAKYSEIEAAGFEAPVFEQYMLTLCNGDMEIYQLLLQCLGVAISNVYGFRTKKALFLVGKGNTGKSQLKKIAEYLIGNENISNIDLKKVNEQFGMSSLYQKRLAGCNDMSYQRVEDMSIFKQLTGGDAIEIEFKHKNSFSFLFKGFLWFNCNKLPRFGGDTGKWVYERIMPVYCNNVIPREKQDPTLFEKMLKEKNSILKNAIIELNRVVNNNYKFIEPSNMQVERDKYEVENNTLLTFINECCYLKEDTMPSMKTKRSTFKKAYENWIKLNNNGRGKLSSRDINLLLETEYGETYSLYNGIWYMSKIVIDPSAKEELGIYDDYQPS